MVAALTFIIANAGKFDVDGVEVLPQELEQLGLPRDICRAICKSFIAVQVFDLLVQPGGQGAAVSARRTPVGSQKRETPPVLKQFVEVLRGVHDAKTQFGEVGNQQLRTHAGQSAVM